MRPPLSASSTLLGAPLDRSRRFVSELHQCCTAWCLCSETAHAHLQILLRSRNTTKYVNVRRKQFPLTPARATPLYSMQGTTADPGMIAYWFFPQRCSPTVKWLIVYVMLSRPRSLATLKSVGMANNIRTIIEQGPPEQLVDTSHKLFDGKIEETKSVAAQAAKHYGLLPGLIP